MQPIERPLWYWQEQALFVHILVQTRASSDAITGIHENQLKIRLRAAAVENRANESLCRFLAKQFAVPKSQIFILSGQTSRHKKICIQSPTKYPSILGISKPV